MAAKQYNFESWKRNEEVDPQYFGEHLPEAIPINEVLLDKSWRVKFLSRGHIEQEQLDLIRQKQRELFDYYLNRRIESIRSKFKIKFDEADLQMEFLVDTLAEIQNKILDFRNKYPDISKLVYLGADLSYLVDPDLFWILSSTIVKKTKFHRITYYECPDELMQLGSAYFVNQNSQSRNVLESYCQFKTLSEQVQYLEKLKEDVEKRRKDKRGNPNWKGLTDCEKARIISYANELLKRDPKKYKPRAGAFVSKTLKDGVADDLKKEIPYISRYKVARILLKHYAKLSKEKR